MVRLDVLPQQGHPMVALLLQIRYFVEYAGGGATALPASGIGHYAIGTEIVAPAHNGDVAGKIWAEPTVRVSHHGRFRWSTASTLMAFCPASTCPHQIRQVQIGSGSHHHVHHTLFQQLLFASARPYSPVWPQSANGCWRFCCLQCLQPSQHTLFGVVAH